MFNNLERSKIDADLELDIQKRFVKLTSQYATPIKIDNAIKKVATELSLKQKEVRQHICFL
jgi:hypothetical protein